MESSIVNNDNGGRWGITTHHPRKRFSSELFSKGGVEGRAWRREWGRRIERKGTTTKELGQQCDVGGATRGDAEV